MNKLIWYLTQVLNQTRHSISNDLNITVHDVVYISKHNPRVDHHLYLRCRKLIDKRIDELPTNTEYQHRYKAFAEQELKTLLTPRPVPSHHTKHENITAKPCTSAKPIFTLKRRVHL